MSTTLYRPYFGKNIVFKDGDTDGIFEIRGLKYVLTVVTRSALPEQLWYVPGLEDPVFLVALYDDMSYKWSVSHSDAFGSSPCSQFDREAVRFFNLSPYCS